MTLELRRAAATDFPVLLELNEAEIPKVNLVSEQRLAWFADHSDWFYICEEVCEEAGRLAGFIIGLPAGLPYDSMNYRWFNSRYERFLYNDRIVVAPDFRGRGVSRLLYGRLCEEAQRLGLARLCCEVNVRPKNAVSLAAHERLGFVEAGRQETENGAKEVAMLVLELAGAD